MSKVVFNIEYTPSTSPKRATKEELKKWSDARQFYNLTADYNYITYSLNGEKTQTHKDYLDYMEKSTGAFDRYGFIENERLEKIKQELANTKSTIWHGFISFEEDLASKFDNVDECIHFINRTFSSLIKGSAVKMDNLEIMASLHRDTDHRHIHFMFYEKEPTHINRDGTKSYTTKNVFNQVNIDNFMIEANLYLDEHKQDFYTSRNEVMDLLKTQMGTLIKSDYGADQTKKKLEELSKNLPKTGRLQYGAENIKHLHNDIDNIVSCALKSDEKIFEVYKELNKALAHRESLISKIRQENKIIYVDGKRLKPNELKEEAFNNSHVISEGRIKDELKYIEDLKKDMNTRLGNIVLVAAKEIKLQNEVSQTKIAWSSANSKHEKIRARKERKIVDKIYHSFIQNIGKEIYGIQEDYTYALHKAEKEIEKENKEY